VGDTVGIIIFFYLKLSLKENDCGCVCCVGVCQKK
jgi:hypothetical protein